MKNLKAITFLIFFLSTAYLIGTIFACEAPRSAKVYDVNHKQIGIAYVFRDQFDFTLQCLAFSILAGIQFLLIRSIEKKIINPNKIASGNSEQFGDLSKD
jgi:hypothetical protein